MEARVETRVIFDAMEYKLASFLSDALDERKVHVAALITAEFDAINLDELIKKEISDRLPSMIREHIANSLRAAFWRQDCQEFRQHLTDVLAAQLAAKVVPE